MAASADAAWGKTMAWKGRAGFCFICFKAIAQKKEIADSAPGRNDGHARRRAAISRRRLRSVSASQHASARHDFAQCLWRIPLSSSMLLLGVKRRQKSEGCF